MTRLRIPSTVSQTRVQARKVTTLKPAEPERLRSRGPRLRHCATHLIRHMDAAADLGSLVVQKAIPAAPGYPRQCFQQTRTVDIVPQVCCPNSPGSPHHLPPATSHQPTTNLLTFLIEQHDNLFQHQLQGSSILSVGLKPAIVCSDVLYVGGMG
ncbi:hypothetical protein BD289DRAFT_29554 [Coniella lustricola]|uniref:Uncharacterized protein n=1 Tax=Coniella lustricola TaxID=2025994 RepID=A0A2T3AJ50_9PEZI|nr:hypothetical protein BD289DRAFT_29554 [Coniella lustricola]